MSMFTYNADRSLQRKSVPCAPRFALIICFLASLTPATDIIGQDFDRLPPTASEMQLERLPRVEEGTSKSEGTDNSTRRIEFAGGTISLQVPRGWWAGEVPAGREIRLAMAPQRPANVRKMPVDGMWIAYHAVPSTQSIGEQALMRELTIRLRSIVGSDATVSPSSTFKFEDWPAVVAEFSFLDPTLANRKVTGRHVLARTDWGLFEFHASSLDENVVSRSKSWTATWESLKLNPPATSDGALAEASRSGSIVGNWKSYRSRMKFASDGRVTLIPDSVAGLNTGPSLNGTYEARDDLIFVRWNDGSRLNFRWRLDGNDLFLTDHQGQISQLKRVFN